MEPKIWTANIRLTLINWLVKFMLAENVIDVALGQHTEVYERIKMLSSASDHVLNNSYSFIMNGSGRILHSPKLEWPEL